MLLLCFAHAGQAEEAHPQPATVAPAADSAAGTGNEGWKGGSLMVTAAKDGGYVPADGASPLKVPVTAIETPVTMQVITPELINDQQAFRLQDALRNVAGVTMDKNESKGQEYDTAFIRGFSQRPFRAGLRTLGSDTIDMSSVERVEVIKGPDAVTFGDAQPGGIVNIITKGATLTPFATDVVGTLGSYESRRMALDTGGGLGEDVGVRLNVASASDESFRDHVHHESISVSPAVLWRIAGQTSLDVRGTYKHENRMLDPGVYFDVNHRPVADISTFLGDPSTEGLTVDDGLVDATLSHAFLPSLSMRTRAVYHDLSVDIEAIRTNGNPTAGNTIGRRYDGSDVDLYELSFSNDFIVRLGRSGPVDTTLVVGADYRRMHKVYTNRMSAALTPISIINPVYNFDPGSTPVLPGAGNENLLDAVGVYVQGVFAMLDDSLHLMLGGRFDSVDSAAINGAGVKTDGRSDGYNWQAGALYKLLPHLYPYATISTSFDPQSVSRIDVHGNYLDPEMGIQYEGGFKAPFCDDAFALTASAYRIEKKDVSIADVDNPGFQVNGGELSSQGIELTAGGDLTPEWGVYGSYAYTDTNVDRSDTLPEGEHFQGIPVHSGSLWAVHTQHEGRLAGLRLGAGAFLVGERNGDAAATFTLPGYGTFDALIGYRCAPRTLRALTLQFNVKNILDKEYYESGSGYSFMPGAPRTYVASMGIDF
jgi:iron complex outermembrane receptor protein